MAYWGQNSAGMKYPENPEKTLKDVCQEMKYDIIVIGFVVTFFGASNKGEVRTSRHDHFAMIITAHLPPFRYECNLLSNITAAQEIAVNVSPPRVYHPVNASSLLML